MWQIHGRQVRAEEASSLDSAPYLVALQVPVHGGHGGPLCGGPPPDMEDVEEPPPGPSPGRPMEDVEEPPPGPPPGRPPADTEPPPGPSPFDQPSDQPSSSVWVQSLAASEARDLLCQSSVAGRYRAALFCFGVSLAATMQSLPPRDLEFSNRVSLVHVQFR